jgi:hypothetical protein
VTGRQSKAFALCLRFAPPEMQGCGAIRNQSDENRWYGDPVQERKAAGRH